MYSLKFCVRFLLPERYQRKPAYGAQFWECPVIHQSAASSARRPRPAGRSHYVVISQDGRKLVAGPNETQTIADQLGPTEFLRSRRWCWWHRSDCRHRRTWAYFLKLPPNSNDEHTHTTSLLILAQKHMNITFIFTAPTSTPCVGQEEGNPADMDQPPNMSNCEQRQFEQQELSSCCNGWLWRQ